MGVPRKAVLSPFATPLRAFHAVSSAMTAVRAKSCSGRIQGQGTAPINSASSPSAETSSAGAERGKPGQLGPDRLQQQVHSAPHTSTQYHELRVEDGATAAIASAIRSATTRRPCRRGLDTSPGGIEDAPWREFGGRPRPREPGARRRTAPSPPSSAPRRRIGRAVGVGRRRAAGSRPRPPPRSRPGTDAPFKDQPHPDAGAHVQVDEVVRHPCQDHASARRGSRGSRRSRTPGRVPSSLLQRVEEALAAPPGQVVGEGHLAAGWARKRLGSPRPRP